MCTALRYTIHSSNPTGDGLETWIVCPADGQSAGSDDLVRPYLQPSRHDIHLVVGVKPH